MPDNNNNNSAPKRSLIQEQVIRYLELHPEFLTRYPALLEKLVIRHDSGEATSLIEHQVRRLQEKNRDLNRQLRQLVQVAGENEQLMTRLHQLTLDLVTEEDLGQFFERLVHALESQFQADAVAVGLFGELPQLKAGLPMLKLEGGNNELKQFQTFFDKQQTSCGRLSRSKLGFLFPTQQEEIQSSALVPLGDAAEYGLLAIGSADPARFYPGMGTLFLELLGDVISHRLAASDIVPRRKSA